MDAKQWAEYEVGKLGTLEIGDSVVLFPSGDVRLGNTMFAAGIPIDNFYFANGHRARRRIDKPNHLYLMPPDGPERIYRHGYNAWYRVIPYVKTPIELIDVIRGFLRFFRVVAWIAGMCVLVNKNHDYLAGGLFVLGVGYWFYKTYDPPR